MDEFIDFDDKKRIEQGDTAAPELRRILKNLFPHATGMKRIRSLAAQRVGLDVQLYSNENPAWVGPTIDFKFREKLWPDFCLEYEHLHDDGHVTVGWVADDSKCSDYIAYIFKHPLWLCYLIPLPSLHSAWQYSGHIWIDVYRDPKKHRSRNKTYWTHWCPVPRDELLHVMGGIRVADQLLAD
jgi:hypothetical protein